MIDDDTTVARLRHELGAVDVRTHADQIDRMLRRVHARRQEQRQQMVQMVAALAVVLVAVAGAFVVSWRPAGPDQVSAASPLVDWPVRGEFAGDRGLIDRAEAAWRGSPRPPAGPVKAIYAGQRVERMASMVVVVLVCPLGGGRTEVAFVTSPIDVHNTPDASSLAVRATATAEPGQRAIGFLSAQPNPGDDAIRGGGSLGFMLAAPGADIVDYRTAMIDDELGELRPLPSDGVAWFITHARVGAWNSVIVVPSEPRPIEIAFAEGLGDPDTEPVQLTSDNGVTKVVGDVQDGDLITTADGVLGVATADGTVDTRLTSLVGIPEIDHSTLGRLVERDGLVYFESQGQGEVRPGNRVVIDANGVTFNLGRLTRDAGGWRLDREADPATTVLALRVRTR